MLQEDGTTINMAAALPRQVMRLSGSLFLSGSFLSGRFFLSGSQQKLKHKRKGEKPCISLH